MAGMISKAGYRASQFFKALNPRLTVQERDLIEETLGPNPPALELFNRMSRADQKHAVAVLQTALQLGQDDPALREAALLHDVGKALGQPLLYRVAIVLLKAFWPALLAKLANASLDCPFWRRPFVIHAQHHQIGADWAEQAGCDPLTVSLIKIHQHLPAAEPQTEIENLHKILYTADGMN